MQAISAAANGDALIAPSITARLLAQFARSSADGDGRVVEAAIEPTQPVDPLTEREEEVLVTVARGRTNAEIATDLHISLSTVKSHLASLMSKLGARNRGRDCHVGLRNRPSELTPRPPPTRWAPQGRLRVIPCSDYPYL